MVYDVKCLAEVLRSVSAEGMESVIVGSTVYMLRLGIEEFEDDVDLFATNFSPVFDEDLIREAAERIGCEVGVSEWGTPRLECVVRDECIVPVELHENIHDFYVPPEMVEDAETLTIEGFEVRVLRVEDYVLLKARAGRDRDLEDLNYIADLIKSGTLKVDLRFVKERLRVFDEDEQKLIVRRLTDAGMRP
ncbi:MAG: nucleotidyltransferase [Zestosphaera sp.]